VKKFTFAISSADEFLVLYRIGIKILVIHISSVSQSVYFAFCVY